VNSVALPRRRVAALQRVVGTWYRRVRRDHPWRRTRDPYRVWVSEVMLQQTRIAAVLPAYERFLRAFPTIADLAAADDDAVLSLWSGLGYYTRARSLHAAARSLVESGRDEFPRDIVAARRLPGVGPYTAAAVLSIAYGQPHAAVDGNIVRVLSRIECFAGRGHSAYAPLAQALLDPAAPGDWNQALMELGQSICLPRAPRCPQCPVRTLCRARRDDRVDSFPTARARPVREQVEVDMTIARDDAGRVVLERGVFPYLPHLWLPLLGALRGARELATIRHAIVHRDFRIRIHHKQATAEQLRRLVVAASDGERRSFDATGIQGIGRSSLLSKALRLAAASPRSCEEA